MNDPPEWLMPLAGALSAAVVIAALVMTILWLCGDLGPPKPLSPLVTCSSGPAQVSKATELNPLIISCPDGKVYRP